VQKGTARLVGKGGESVEIPSSVRTLLAEIARNMEAGKAVSVVAENYDLHRSVQQTFWVSPAHSW